MVLFTRHYKWKVIRSSSLSINLLTTQPTSSTSSLTPPLWVTSEHPHNYSTHTKVWVSVWNDFIILLLQAWKNDEKKCFKIVVFIMKMCVNLCYRKSCTWTHKLSWSKLTWKTVASMETTVRSVFCPEIHTVAGKINNAPLRPGKTSRLHSTTNLCLLE